MKFILVIISLIIPLFAQNISLNFGDINPESQTLEILYESDVEIEEFTIHFSGLLIINAYGGAADELYLYANDDFVYGGYDHPGPVEPGSGVLFYLTIAGFTDRKSVV